MFRTGQMLFASSDNTTTNFTDCGDIEENTNFEYQVYALNEGNKVGSPASLVASSSGTSVPDRPVLSLISSAVSTLEVDVGLPCDTGGRPILSADVLVTDVATGVVAYNETIPCCSATVGSLTINTNYEFQVRISNGMNESSWTTGLFNTTNGIPTPPTTHLKQAFVNFLDLDIVQPTDSGGGEIANYELKVDAEDGQSVMIPFTLCTEIDGANVCQNVVRIDNLERSTPYVVSIRALGVGGFSDWDVVTHMTDTGRPGQVQFKEASKEAEEGKDTEVIVERVAGLTGNISIGFSIESPNNETWVCSCGTQFGCYCSVSDATPVGSVDGVLLFEDGTTRQPIVLTMYDNDVYVPVEVTTIALLNDTATGGASVAALDTMTINMADNGDAGTIAFVTSDIGVAEDVSSVGLQLIRTGGKSGDVSVIIKTRDGSGEEGQDYDKVESVVFFVDQQVEQFFPIRITDNVKYDETDRSFFVTISEPSGGASVNQTATEVRVVVSDDADIEVPSAPLAPIVTGKTGGLITLKLRAPEKNGGLNVTIDGYRVGIRQTGSPTFAYRDTTDIDMTFTGLRSSLDYDFVVSAKNVKGYSEYSTPLIVTTMGPTQPSQPLDISSVSLSGGAVSLAWGPPMDTGGLPVSGYKAWLEVDGALQLVYDGTQNSALKYTYEGLNASTPYEFRISALNGIGSNHEGVQAVVLAETKGPNVPSTPQAPLFVSRTGGSLTLSVVRPADTGGIPSESFKVMIRKSQTPIFDIGCSGTFDSSGIGECTVFRLSYSTSWDVQAIVINAEGESSSSAVSVQETGVLSLPSPPQNVTADTVMGGYVDLSWTEPQDFGGVVAISGYIVLMRSAEEFLAGAPGNEIYDGRSNAAMSTRIWNLSQSTVYYFTVVAVNPSSVCASSDAYRESDKLEVTTLTASVPSVPAAPILMSKTGGALTISWSAPIDNGGTPLLGYSLFELVDGSMELRLNTIDAGTGPQQLTFAHYGLTAASSHTYTVVAVNEVGSSATSDVLAVSTTSTTAPTSPLNLQQTGNLTGGVISLEWEVPLDEGGAPVVRYAVYRNEQLLTDDVTAAVTNTYTDDDGLNELSDYKYYIKAANVKAFGVRSATLDAVTGNATVAESPHIGSVDVAGSYMTIEWSAHKNSGGSPIQDYTLNLYKDATSNLVSSYTGGNLTHTFSGILANTDYILSLTARNAKGDSSSATQTLTTGDVVKPQRPPAPIVESVFGGSATLEITFPDDTGGAIVGDVYIEVYQDDAVIATVTQSGDKVEVFGLLAETQYSFHTKAFNPVGSSTSSDAVAVTTGVLNFPGMVKGVSLASKSWRFLNIEWESILDTGGAASVDYEVLYSTPGVDDVTLTVSGATGVSIVDLTANTEYTIRVRASNSAGFGSWSSDFVVSTEEAIAGSIKMKSASVNVREDAGSVVLEVIRVDGSAGLVTCTYTTGDVTAQAPDNYIASSGTLDFPADVKSQTVEIAIVNNTLYTSADMSFTFTLTAITSNSGSLGDVLETTVHITDDGDAGTLSFSNSIYYVSESNGTVALVVQRENGNSGVVDVDFTLSPSLTGTATESSDFTFPDQSLQFADGQTELHVSIPIINDDVYEYPNETFYVTFSVAGGGALTGDIVTAEVVILDDGDQSTPGLSGTATVVAGTLTGGAMEVSWTPPLDTGGEDLDILSYVITMSEDGKPDVVQTSTDPSSVLGGLTSSTEYSISVAAVNAIGQGPVTAAAKISTAAPSVPTAPLNIISTASTGGSITLSWSSPFDTGGVPVTGYNVYLVEDSNSRTLIYDGADNLATEFTHKGLMSSTEYMFQVQAINFVSAATSSGHISPVVTFSTSEATPPEPPLAPEIPWKTGGAIEVQMETPADTGGIPIDMYILYMNSPESPTSFSVVYEGNLSSTIIYELAESTDYTIKYKVRNSAGTSSYGQPTAFTTLKPTLPSAPLNPNVTLATGGSLSVEWSEPVDTGGSPISGYVIRVFTDGVTKYVGYDGKANPERSATVYGLSASTTYSLTIVAYNPASLCETEDNLIESEIFTATTLEASLPTAPLSLKFSGETGGRIDLTWFPPLDYGGVDIIRYDVFLVPASGPLVELYQAIGHTNTSFTHYNLIAETTYQYQVVAVNEIGSGDLTTAITASTTSASPPSAPVNIDQVQASTTGGSIGISWESPLDLGGKPLTKFIVYRDDVAIYGINENDLSTTYIDIMGLAAASTYRYSIKAVNSDHAGEKSDPFDATTSAATPPKSPAFTSFTPSGGEMALSWEANADMGGIELRFFEITVSDANGVVDVFTGTDLEHTFSGLVAETNYTFAMVAANDAGRSTSVTETATTLAAEVPGKAPAPQQVSVRGGSVTLTVETPINTGGAEVTKILLYQDSTLLREVTSYDEEIILTGLLAETPYSFYAFAVNSVGSGERSDSLVVTTSSISLPGLIAAAPTLVDRSALSLHFAWSPPEDTGGDTSLSYEVLLVNANTGDEIRQEVTSLDIEIESLSLATIYEASIRAISDAGTGDWGPVVELRTEDGSGGTLSFVESAISVSEDAGTLTITVVRNGGSLIAVDVEYEVLSTGTAELDVDYEIPAAVVGKGVLSFDVGVKTQVIEVDIINDDEYVNPDEFFQLNLNSVTTGGTLGAPTVTTVTILDDNDAGQLQLVDKEYTVLESAETVELTVTRTGGLSSSVSVLPTGISGTAELGLDFRSLTKRIQVDDMSDMTVFSVSIRNDNTFEYPDEYFYVQISDPQGGAILGAVDTVKVTIVDDGDISKPGPCSAPTKLSATGGSITFSWDPPINTGGATTEISSYKVFLTGDDGFSTFVTTTDTTARVGGLSELSMYTATVAAVNEKGMGPLSSSIEGSTTSATIPTGPSNVQMVGSTGGSISLTWDLPLDTGGVAITGYKIFVLNSNTVLEVVYNGAGDPTRAATIYHLIAESSYSYRIQAINALNANHAVLFNFGNDLTDLLTFTTTVETLPGPVALNVNHFAAPTGGAINLGWNTPQDTGRHLFHISLWLSNSNRWIDDYRISYLLSREYRRWIHPCRQWHYDIVQHNCTFKTIDILRLYDRCCQHSGIAGATWNDYSQRWCGFTRNIRRFANRRFCWGCDPDQRFCFYCQ